MIKESEIISKVLLSIEQYKGSIDLFRTAVLRNEYTPAKKYFSRLFLWKACLITESLNFREWDTTLTLSRVIYHKLRQEKDMVVQWHLLDEDNEFYLPQQKTTKSSRSNQNLKPAPQHLPRIENIADDPLAMPLDGAETHTPSQAELDNDLLMSIIMDVQRLFPGETIFHDNSEIAMVYKRQIISVLYVWSKCNSSIGYKQGIHEIIGLMFLNLRKELIPLPTTNTVSADERHIFLLFDEKYLEHDLFTILNRFTVSSGLVLQFYASEAELMSSINVFNIYLMKVDQLIHYNLVTKLRLESQLWIIRYLRLLLLRELGNDLEVPSLLWDKLAAIDTHTGLSPIPDTVMFLVVVLLIHIKSELVLCDFSEALALLLHYPIAAKIKANPAFIEQVFQDALKLTDCKRNDMKLYEYGRKMNKKYNSNIKVNLGYTPSPNGSASPTVLSRSNSPSPAPSSPTSAKFPPDPKAERMAFEKFRLEARLKKRAQEMMNNKL